LIGSSTAEHIKINLGNAFPDEEIQTIEVKGRDLTTGIPKILILDSNEIRKVISEQVNTIIDTIRIALEQMPPELAADLIDKGIVLTGGGSLLKNLDALLREQTKLPINRTSDPFTDVAVGSGKALSDLSVLSDVAIQ
jgi:rod shape-determining protein MreB